MAQQTRYILNKKDGRLLIWNQEIATNPDYVEITTEEASDILSGINFKDVLRRKFRDEREEELNSIPEPKVSEEEMVEPEEKPEVFSKPYVARAMPPAPPPTKYSVKEIKEAVGDDPEKAALAIEDEKSQLKPRPSLIRDLKLIIAKAKAAEEEEEDEETEEEPFDDGAVADVNIPSDDPAIDDMLKDA